MAWIHSSTSSTKLQRLPKKTTSSLEYFPLQQPHQAHDSVYGTRQSHACHGHPRYTPEIPKHQRSRSASTIAQRPSYEEDVLNTVPSTQIYRKRDMASVMGPGRPVYMPQDSGFGPDPFAGSNTMTRDFARVQGRPTSIATNGMPPPRRSPTIPPGSYAQFDNRPVMYNQNGRPSSSSSTASSVISRESFEAGMRSPASTHRTSFGSWESPSKRPEYGWQRPAPIKQYRKKAQPGEQLAALPDEVLDLIMSNLRELHLADNGFSCATCMMRDFCAVALGSRRLLLIARKALYTKIQLVGNDSQVVKKRHKITYGARMILLRRTLRANPQLAALVHSLKVPVQPQGVELEKYLNLVASVIMACPNFEQLVGPHQPYDHSFSRLFHALSTREKLKEMTWVVEPSPYQRQHDLPTEDTEPEELFPQQSTAFLSLNMNWSQLTTLSIHCLPGAALTPVSLVTTAISTMPSLQHLYLSQLSQTSFDDTDLLSLPKLTSLSLTNMRGVTSSGLSTFASRPSSQSLKSLKLQQMSIESLPALARVFMALTSLESFTLVQTIIPLLPEGELIWLFPYFTSKTLRRLHWDITELETCANVADSILAKSIAASGFPSLRMLRTPNDPEGLFQSLCRPLEKIEKSGDKYRGRGLVATMDSGPSTPKTPITPGKSPLKSPNGSHLFGVYEPRQSTDLHQARLAAQKRLEEARKRPRFTVNVIDEDGTIDETWGMAGFMGELASQIQYCLTPDAGASDENGGLVQFSDVQDNNREDLRDKEGCTGRWNNYGYSNYDRKEKEKWWHTERARWTEIHLP